MIKGKKRKGVIISTPVCEKMEKLRLAFEVLTASRVIFEEFDLGNGEGLINAGGENKQFTFIFDNDSQIRFSLKSLGEVGEERYTALFYKTSDKTYGVKVAPYYKPSQDNRKWLVGTSKDDCWEEPIF